MIKIDEEVEVECPYCGHKNIALAVNPYDHLLLTLCNCEDGGCDKYFVSDISVKVRITAKGRKIEATDDTD